MNSISFKVFWRLALFGLTLLMLVYAVIYVTTLKTEVRLSEELAEGFGLIEEEAVSEDLYRAQSSVKAFVENLAVKQLDWSFWDDAWEYVAQPNAAFENSNINALALSNLRINYMAFFNDQGALVKAAAADYRSGDSIEFSPSLLHLLTASDKLILQKGDTVARRGFIILDEGISAVVIAPILPTVGYGEMRGTLVFASLIDSAEIAKMGDDAQVKMCFCVGDFLGELKEQNLSNHREINAEVITAYAKEADIFGVENLVVHIDHPRKVYQQSLHTSSQVRAEIFYTAKLMVVFATLSFIAIFVFLVVVLHKAVFRRLQRIAFDAELAGEMGQYEVRLFDVCTMRQHGKGDEIRRMSAAVNMMLDTLQKTYEDLLRKDGDLRLLFDTIPIGLLSLDKNFKIEAGASSKALRLLEKRVELKFTDDGLVDLPDFEGIDGQTLGQALRMDADQEAKLNEFLTAFSLELMNEDDMAGLNPFPEWRVVHSAQDVKWVRLFYRIIREKSRDSGSKNHRILVVLEEITDKVEQDHELQKLNFQVNFLRVFIEDPAALRQFVEETNAINREVQRTSWLQKTEIVPEIEDVYQLFRLVHTLHGSAAAMGFECVATAAYQLESILAMWREKAQKPEQEVSGLSSINSSEILLQLADSVKNAERLLQEYLRDSTENIEVEVSKAWTRLVRATPKIAESLHKQARLDIVGGNTLLPSDFANDLADILSHLLRNAIAHGIESPDERLEQGKSIEGNIAIRIWRKNHQVVVGFSDDGRGIDADKIVARAATLGIELPSDCSDDQKILAAITHPGFTTRDYADNISGRGVGLDAVQHQIMYMHGYWELESIVGEGTTFSITLPLP